MNINEEIIENILIEIETLKDSFEVMTLYFDELRDRLKGLKISELSNQDVQNLLGLVAFTHESGSSLQRIEGQLLYSLTSEFLQKKEKKPNLTVVELKNND